MIEPFFTQHFDKPAGPPMRPRMKIHHPAIQRIYDEYGVMTSKTGLFRVVDPEEWQESYLPWFYLMRDEDGVFEGPELYPFMTTAFGQAYIFANLPDEDLVGFVDVTDNFHVLGSGRAYFLRHINDPIFHAYNLHGDLYEELAPAGPPLLPGECYGFFPLLSMGGEATLESVQRVKLREHLDILAQFGGLPFK